MPHINLLYPFLPEDQFEKAVPILQEALKKTNIKPFKLNLSKFCYFDHGKSCTIWLQPDIEGGVSEEEAKKNGVASNNYIHQIQKALEDCYPHLAEQRPFQPHFSVAQCNGKANAEKLIKEFSENWQTVTFTVDGVYLISRRDFDDPFHVRHHLKLNVE